MTVAKIGGKWQRVQNIAGATKQTRTIVKTPKQKTITTREVITQNYPEYEVEDKGDFYIVKAPQQQYKKTWRKGGHRTYATFSPHELKIGKDGVIKSETHYTTFKQDAGKKSYRREVHPITTVDYENKLEKRWKKRESNKHGREDMRIEYENIRGNVKTWNVVDKYIEDLRKKLPRPEEIDPSNVYENYRTDNVSDKHTKAKTGKWYKIKDEMGKVWSSANPQWLKQKAKDVIYKVHGEKYYGATTGKVVPLTRTGEFDKDRFAYNKLTGGTYDRYKQQSVHKDDVRYTSKKFLDMFTKEDPQMSFAPEPYKWQPEKKKELITDKPKENLYSLFAKVDQKVGQFIQPASTGMFTGMQPMFGEGTKQRQTEKEKSQSRERIRTAFYNDKLDDSFFENFDDTTYRAMEKLITLNEPTAEEGWNLWQNPEARKLLVRKGIMPLTKEQQEYYKINPEYGTDLWKDIEYTPKYWEKVKEEYKKDPKRAKKEWGQVKEMLGSIGTKEMIMMGGYTGGLYALDRATSHLSPIKGYGAGDVIDLTFAVPDIAKGIIIPTPQNRAIAMIETADLVTDWIPYNAVHVRAKNILKLKSPVTFALPSKTKIKKESAKLVQKYDEQAETRDFEKMDSKVNELFKANVQPKIGNQEIETVLTFKEKPTLGRTIDTKISFAPDGSFVKTRVRANKEERYFVDKDGSGVFEIYKDGNLVVQKKIKKPKISRKFSIERKPFLPSEVATETRRRLGSGDLADEAITQQFSRVAVSGWLDNEHFLDTELKDRKSMRKTVITTPRVRDTYENVLHFADKNGMSIIESDRKLLKKEIEDYIIQWKGDGLEDDLIVPMVKSGHTPFKGNVQMQHIETIKPKTTIVRRISKMEGTPLIHRFKPVTWKIQKPFITNKGFRIDKQRFPTLHSVLHSIQYKKTQLDKGTQGFYDTHDNTIYVSDKLNKAQIMQVLKHERLHQLIKTSKIGEKGITEIAMKVNVKTKGKDPNKIEEEVVTKIVDNPKLYKHLKRRLWEKRVTATVTARPKDIRKEVTRFLERTVPLRSVRWDPTIRKGTRGYYHPKKDIVVMKNPLRRSTRLHEAVHRAVHRGDIPLLTKKQFHEVIERMRRTTGASKQLYSLEKRRFRYDIKKSYEDLFGKLSRKRADKAISHEFMAVELPNFPEPFMKYLPKQMLMSDLKMRKQRKLRSPIKRRKHERPILGLKKAELEEQGTIGTAGLSAPTEGQRLMIAKPTVQYPTTRMEAEMGAMAEIQNRFRHRQHIKRKEQLREVLRKDINYAMKNRYRLDPMEEVSLNNLMKVQTVLDTQQVTDTQLKTLQKLALRNRARLVTKHKVRPDIKIKLKTKVDADQPAWKKDKPKFKRKRYKTFIQRFQDPYYRYLGKKKYSDILNKLLRERYGNIYA